MKRNDLILLTVLLVAGIAFWGGYRAFHSREGACVAIEIDGVGYETLPLSEDTQLEIPGAGGGTNILTIREGQASITEADCPDRLCVHQPAISRDGESLICLPHKVIVKVLADPSEDDLDAIAR